MLLLGLFRVCAACASSVAPGGAEDSSVQSTRQHLNNRRCADEMRGVRRGRWHVCCTTSHCLRLPKGVSMGRYRHTPLLVAVTATLACSGQPAGPSDPETQLPITEASADYVFHRSADDVVDTGRQQAFHVWVLAVMDVSPGRRIDYYKYRDRTHMRQLTGRDTNGWADPATMAVHSIWPWDAHEAAHVLAGPLGQPTEFFNEGLAMAFSVDVVGERFEPLWNNRSVHDWCAEALASGVLLGLADIVESNAFRSRPNDVAYQTAGSFVRFLLDTKGMPQMKRLLNGNWRDASRAAVNLRFASVYGVDLSAGEAEWHSFLRAR